MKSSREHAQPARLLAPSGVEWGGIEGVERPGDGYWPVPDVVVSVGAAEVSDWCWYCTRAG